MSGGKRKAEAEALSTGEDRAVRPRLPSALQTIARSLLAHILGYIVDNQGPYPYMVVCRGWKDHILQMSSREIPLVQLHEGCFSKKSKKKKKGVMYLTKTERRARYPTIPKRCRARVSHIDATPQTVASISLPNLQSMTIALEFGTEQCGVPQILASSAMAQVRQVYFDGVAPRVENEPVDFTGKGPFPSLECLKVRHCDLTIPSIKAIFPNLKRLEFGSGDVSKCNVVVDSPLDCIVVEDHVVGDAFLQVADGGSIDTLFFHPSTSVRAPRRLHRGCKPLRVKRLYLTHLLPIANPFAILRERDIIPATVDVLVDRWGNAFDYMPETPDEELMTINAYTREHGLKCFRIETARQVAWHETHVAVFEYHRSKHMSDWWSGAIRWSYCAQLFDREEDYEVVENPPDDGKLYWVEYKFFTTF